MLSKPLSVKINHALLSHYPIIYIRGKEEDRVQDTIAHISKGFYSDKEELISWSSFSGFSDTHTDHEPIEAIKRICSSDKPCMYLLKDFSDYLNDPLVARAVRDMYLTLKSQKSFVFFSGNSQAIPGNLNDEIYLIDMPLPTDEEILAFLVNVFSTQKLESEISSAMMYEYALAMKGLTLRNIEHLILHLLHSEKPNYELFVDEILAAKSQLLKKESCLEFVPIKHNLEQIGGLDNLKDWVTQRKHLFTQEGFNSGLPLPSGVLFMGVSGCGKSMAAKAIASAWNIPLVRLDMSLVLSGSYGPAEQAFKHAIELAEQIAPLVLWIDELENSFGYDENMQGHGNMNIFSSFLTWMQEKPDTVFLAATANRIMELPAELMRKGRFDQLFFLDLPNMQERETIMQIHLARQGAKVEDFNLSYLAVATQDWSGAEIEQAVKSARIKGSLEDRAFNEKDLGLLVAEMVPLAHTMREQIKAIKDWSFQRATPASREPKKS